MFLNCCCWILVCKLPSDVLFGCAHDPSLVIYLIWEKDLNVRSSTTWFDFMQCYAFLCVAILGYWFVHLWNLTYATSCRRNGASMLPDYINLVKDCYFRLEVFVWKCVLYVLYNVISQWPSWKLSSIATERVSSFFLALNKKVLNLDKS